MTAPEPHTYWWRLCSGFRFLRATCPENAEYLYAFQLESLRVLTVREEAGYRGAYNVVRRDIAGSKKNATYFPDGSARTWSGEIPAEFMDLPTVESQLPDATSLHAIQAMLSEAAEALPERTVREYRARLQHLEAGRETPIRLSDLSPMHTKASTAADARSRARQASAIMQLIDAVNPSRGAEDAAVGLREFAQLCERQWKGDLLDGFTYAPLLLLLEVAAQSPAAFAQRVSHFACGQLPCSHLTCNANVAAVSAANAAQSVVADGLHAAQVYVLRNEVELKSVLDAASGPISAAWIEQASRHLLSQGEQRRQQLLQSRTMEEFYVRHHELLPFVAAAGIGFKYLTHRANAQEARQQYERLRIRAEEFTARSLGALSFDFNNAVDLDPIHRLRNRYHWQAEQSALDADMQLQKWIHDETLFPVFWSDWVSGKVDNLSFSG